MSKSKAPRRSRRPSTPLLTVAQIEQILGTLKPTQPSAPPPPVGPAILAGPSAPAPILWHFQHTHPELPNSIINLCTMAPTIQDARGKAYLLAENFCENIIGFIRENTPTQSPHR